MRKILPPGIDQTTLTKALDAFADVVGEQWVFADEASGLESYLDSYAIVEPDYYAPSAAVAPDSVEQVQAILKIANEYKIPIWTISTGKNLTYGGPAPRLPGSVVLDLKRMNRILEVNEEFGYCLVEPGVSYFDLYEYLQENNIKLWLSVPSPGWGSVLANALERGGGHTPYGDHFGMQCGMEVVLADGEIVRTGMGALPNNNTWQLFKYGYGPYLDGIFTQSNYGVVTKMGMWLMPEPPGYRPFMLTFPREDDIEPLVDIMRPLKIAGVIPNAAVIVNVLFQAAVDVSKSEYYDGTDPIPESAIKKIMADRDIGMWNFFGALYGDERIMDAQWQTIKDAFSAIPGTKFYLREDRPDDPVMKYRAKGMSGVPNLSEFGFINWRGNGGHIDFSPVSPSTGADALKQYRMIRDRCHEYGFDYLGVFVLGWREMHHISTLVFDKTDAADKKRAHDMFAILIEEAAELGYGSYRTHLEYMNQVAEMFSFNDHSLMRLNERLKDALDPNGILAAGKSGIWPKSLRENRGPL